MNNIRPHIETTFIIGAPRGGTTWLQLMLAEHSRIASPPEMDLFSRYLPRLWYEWSSEISEAAISGMPLGLISCFTQTEFIEILTGIVKTSYQKILTQKPSASTILEKTPAYSLHTPLIHKLLPNARFIHVIRDGRDVAMSLVEASKTWGRSWAPNEIMKAAKLWKEYVLAARQAQAYENRYIEIRYEQLLLNGAEELKKTISFLNLEADRNWCEKIYEQYSFEKVIVQKSQHPSIIWMGEAEKLQKSSLKFSDGFFRQGKSGSWHKGMTAKDCWWFDHVAGDLLIELGYAQPGWASTGLIKDSLFTFIAENQKHFDEFRQRLAWKLWHAER